MTQQDPRHILVQVTKVLNRLKIPYIVTGGIAVLVWGRPRFTADIDIVVQLKHEDIEAFEKALRGVGTASYVDKDVMFEALARFGEFNFIDGESGMKVDFWVLKKNNPFEISCLERKRTRLILGARVNFISPEDLILSKLLWHTKGGSTRHLEDIDSVLNISGKTLDWKYLRQWAAKLEVLPLLEKSLPGGGKLQ